MFSAALELPPQPWTLAVCRGLLEQLLVLACVERRIADDLAIALTEVCGNVVRHAAVAGVYRVEIGVDDRQCVIRVRDRGPGFDPDRVEVTDADLGGRGLVVMRAVLDDMRIEACRPGTEVTMIKRVP